MCKESNPFQAGLSVLASNTFFQWNSQGLLSGTQHTQREQRFILRKALFVWAFDVQKLQFHSSNQTGEKCKYFNHCTGTLEDSRFVVQQFLLFSAKGKHRKKKPEKASPTPAIRYFGNRNSLWICRIGTVPAGFHIPGIWHLPLSLLQE